MPDRDLIDSPIPVPPPNASHTLKVRQQLKYLAAFAVVLMICFAFPLGRLLHFTLHDELFSYIPLIPFISIYLGWLNKDKLTGEGAPPRPWAILPALAGTGTLGILWMAGSQGEPFHADQQLCLTTLAFVFFFWAGCLMLLSKKMVWELLFPIAFLIFLVPLPNMAVAQIDAFFQRASAATATAFISAVGTTVLQEHLTLILPNISLTVAPECSGIHSTAVLFITSLLASYLFLSSGWKRMVLVLFIVPLAIARNGFRIFVIAELCVHIGPHMIDSFIHRKGGPIFFALSLIPFFLLLVFLRRLGSNRAKVITQPNS